ncbi:MAG: YgfZ/GcvT domain-containing protein, partial [Gemmatimonadota bacterium]
VEAEGGRPAGGEAFEILRVERGLPAYGREITEGNLLQETGQTERAVDFRKGCYTGQEVVARIHYRGHVNRLLRGLRSGDPGSSLDPGASLFRGDREVGDVRTAVRSPRQGSIALAYVRREVEPGERLALGPGGPPAVEVVELPFTFK